MQTVNNPRALVIGSGFGGLAAAVRLQARGYEVQVLEARDAPGGRAYTYKQDGFVFDGGPTVITAPQLLEELWSLAGEKMSDHIDLRPVSPFYRILFEGGDQFDYLGDSAQMKEQIHNFCPSDVQGWEDFLAHSKEVFDVGFSQLAHRSFHAPGTMLKLIPDLMRLRSHRSVYGLVSKFIKDERLRQVFSFHPLLVGGNPFDTTSIYTLIAYLEREWGVYFPMGGTGALVRGLVELIERKGGKVRCNTAVERIIVENGQAKGVQLDDGSVLDADIVVSNADVATTYKKMIEPQHRRHWTDRRVDRQAYSMSLFVWYFGTKGSYDDVAHHTILLGPRYRGLLKDIFDRKVLADDFSLYLHRPTATDPSLAPEGHDGFYVLSPVPHLDAGVDWREKAEPYRQAIMKKLEATVLPGLSERIVSSRMLTPIDFRDTLRSHKGAAFGMAPIFRQSAYFRPHNKSEDIQGLYFVGASTHPGAGVPGVLSSARVLDEVVPEPIAKARPNRAPVQAQAGAELRVG